jgi:outer membrane receptor protein involved in Fe transport
MHHTTLRTLAYAVRALALGALLTLAARAAESKKNYDLPAGTAAQTLKEFSRISGSETLFAAEAVRGVSTQAVRGELTAAEAVNAMLAGTGLVATQDAKTGAFAVKKAARPNAQTAAQDESGDRQGRLEKVEGKAIKLEEMTVLGTRIRQADLMGPSPVSSYDEEYIKSSGAMTLADFLNQIPQSYSGIASGRNSAPNELNPDFGQHTETTGQIFNFVTGSADSPPAQTGVSGVSLRGLGSGSTLVLVDGRRVAQSGMGNKGTDTRQGFVDLNTIPLGMIERIEVITDGASAIYGADAVAGVINIVLKKDYNGTELSGGYKATEHGGGRERSVNVLSGFVYGKLSGSVSLDFYDRQDLRASDRSFSKHQNHTGIPAASVTADGSTRYGVDYRLNWGYPAVIQASGGTVSGTFNAIPGVRVVLVPVGSTTTPAIAQFIPTTTVISPATVVNSSGQRRGNTASFMDLIPESKRTGATGNLKYAFNDRLEGYFRYRTSNVNSRFVTQPTTSITGSFGAAVTLPAAYNPFNQNVTVGMILYDWGSTAQTVRTTDYAATAGFRGKAGQTWQWDLATSWERQQLKQLTRNFNGAGFAGLLTVADPTQRFNPFLDASAGAPSQAALLETLSVYPTVESASTHRGLDFQADGDVVGIWGGEVKMAFGGSTGRDAVNSSAVNYSSAVTPVALASSVAGTQKTSAVFTEFQVPVFGKPNAAPMVRRLDLQLAGRYEEIGPFSKSVPKYGVSWSPVQPLLLRTSWSKGFRAPGVTEYLTATATNTSTLSDPRRTPPSTPGVVVTSGSNPDPKPELSDNTFAGIVLEPPFIKGLSVQVNYYETVQKDVLEQLTPQTIINNEALFPGRVTRAPASSTDLGLNQPGQITAVNRVFVNFGRVVNRSMDYVVEYTLPWERYGNWRLGLSASRTLESTSQVAPGQPPVVLEGDTAAPPKWAINSSLFWRKGAWSASAFLWYLDGFKSNNAGNSWVSNNSAVVFYPTPSVSKLDLRAGYEFKKGVWRGHGKGLRVSGGVDNVFDKKPPFSDTVWGFNAGLHSQLILGRAYQLSFTIPLN